jgi:hypothetical protein
VPKGAQPPNIAIIHKFDTGRNQSDVLRRFEKSGGVLFKKSPLGL